MAKKDKQGLRVFVVERDHAAGIPEVILIVAESSDQAASMLAHADWEGHEKYLRPGTGFKDGVVMELNYSESQILVFRPHGNKSSR